MISPGARLPGVPSSVAVGVSDTGPMRHVYGQAEAQVRFDWATTGVDAVAAGSDVTVIVDVLSFTTTLTVALDAGITVLPYPSANPALAREYARQHDAVVAAARSQGSGGQPSLSPSSIRGLSSRPARLVLPSPNCSALAHRIHATGALCLGGCLRNATAVAGWLTRHLEPERDTVAVIAAGERWADGGLRPAVEDLWGAGMVIGALGAAGWWPLSPEAEAAAAAYAAVRGVVRDRLIASASGRELIEAGFRSDVDIAAEIDHSSVVPRLVDHAFTPA